MFSSPQEVQSFITERGIRTVDLKFICLFGGMHHISVPSDMIDGNFWKEGLGFDGSNIPGFSSLECGDMSLLPLPETAFEDPFWEMPTLSMFCKIVEADTLVPFLRDPRAVAQRAMDYMTQTGIADRANFSPEFEYYVFDEMRNINGKSLAFYELFSSEAQMEMLVRDNTHVLGTSIPPHGGYHANAPKDKLYDLRAETVEMLGKIGVKVRYHHHEVGAPGQCEIEIFPGDLVSMGDATLKIKYFVKMAAAQRNKVATFMPKPMYGEAGSGMHFHQHLFKGDIPLFAGEEYGGMSKLALSYIAGVLDHAPALLGLTNATTNSYKRLVPGYEAPVHAFFSKGNRSAAIRIPKYATRPEERRMEFRPPDATCNPYIAMAAQLMAGLDGIKRNLDPKAMGLGPLDVNVFKLSEQERSEIKALPTNMEDAMAALQKDHQFLLQGDVFTEDMIQTWIDYKMQNDYIAVRNRPHPYEFELYFDT